MTVYEAVFCTNSIELRNAREVGGHPHAYSANYKGYAMLIDAPSQLAVIRFVRQQPGFVGRLPCTVDLRNLVMHGCFQLDWTGEKPIRLSKIGILLRCIQHYVDSFSFSLRRRLN